ncbi:hypothetical protein QBC47DRAFT_333265 [Echria macrotheca]|uniref:Cdc24/Scd1 N-terminal domain-containing protein n=1 Tax=Echria macrotheca TaxID=438768 RepID=A0AAJ0B3G4_9PEZI|nr:hypothetical protein QBC47DRAFT_333265 [Echria macrotheca]
MDPLSVVASIAGILSAAGAVTKVLAPYLAAARETPKLAVRVNSEVQSVTIILSSLQRFAQNLASVPLQRAALVQVDHVVAVLTDGVFIFSDLEDVVGSLSPGGEFSVRITRLALRSRLQWARKESEITSLLARLQAFKSSASLILNILQSDSTMRAEQARNELMSNVNKLLESNNNMAERLMTLEDTLGAKTTGTRRRSVAVSLRLGHSQDDETKRFLSWVADGKFGNDIVPSSPASPSTLAGPEYSAISSFGFEPDLEASRVYRRVHRETMDFSFRSSIAGSNTMSVFSGLTLGDVSITSVIALPVFAPEISNAHHYAFGDLAEQSVPAQAATINHRPPSPVNSLLYESLEIADQLSEMIGFPDRTFWEEKLDPAAEHPFDILHDLLLEHHSLSKINCDGLDGCCAIERQMGPEGDVAKLCSVLQSRDVSFLNALDAIKEMLAARPATPDSSAARWVDELLESKRESLSDETSHAVDALVYEFLAQERLYFNQLEDLPVVEKQLQMLNLLVKEKFSAIFAPLHAFMDIQLRFLLDIERNLLRPPKYRRWAGAFRAWLKNTELIGKLIASEARTKAILRVRLGSAEGPGNRKSPQVDAIAACFKLVSLPALSLLGHLEFLEEMEYHIVDPYDIRRLDIAESKDILIRAHEEISRIVKREDLSCVVACLKQHVVDRKGYELEQFGDLLLYDDGVEVLHIQAPQPRPSRYRMYTFEKIILFAEEVSPSRLLPMSQDRTQGSLRLKGRIFLAKIEAVVHQIARNARYPPRSCLVIWNGDTKEALELKFTTPSRMQKWTDEVWAAIQTPHCGQHVATNGVDAGVMPLVYPKSWKNKLLERGFIPYAAPEDVSGRFLRA